MRNSITLHLAFAVAVSLCSAVPAQEPTTQPAAHEAKVGTYTTKFTERSPLSEPKELARRLGEKEIS